MNTAIQTMEIQNNDKKIKDMIREFQIEQIQIAKKENSYDELEKRYDALIEKIKGMKSETIPSTKKIGIVNGPMAAASNGASRTFCEPTVSFYVIDMWGNEILMDQSIYIDRQIKDRKRAMEKIWRMVEERNLDFFKWYGDEE